MNRRSILISVLCTTLLIVAGDCQLWGPTTSLSDPNVDSQVWYNFGQTLAADQHGNVHAVWLEITTPDSDPNHRYGTVMYRCWNPGQTGNGWGGAAVALSGVPGATSGFPKIAASGSNVHVVYHSNRTTANEVYLQSGVSAPNCGISWNASDVLVAGIGNLPSVAAHGDDVHVVWAAPHPMYMRPEVYLRSRVPIAGIALWTPTLQVSDLCDDTGDVPPLDPGETPGCRSGIAGNQSSYTPSVAAYGNHVHVAWTDERFDVLGTSTVPHDCLPGGGASCREEEFYDRFTIDRSGSTPIYSASTGDVRLTFDPENQPVASWAPSIAVGPNNGSTVHLVYFDRRDPPNPPSANFTIYYRRSQDEGLTWEPEVRLSYNTSVDNDRPVAAARSNGVAVAWSSGAPTGPRHIALRRAGTNGLFSGEEIVSPVETSNSGQPSVAVDPTGTAHVLWLEDLTVDELRHRRRDP
jgi:hypothetical protein